MLTNCEPGLKEQGRGVCFFDWWGSAIMQKNSLLSVMPETQTFTEIRKHKKISESKVKKTFQ
jgi:hypothetical protein